MSIRFGLFSDLHATLPGAPTRGFSGRSMEDMRRGLTRFADADADFAVSLGDNLQPAATVEEQYHQLADMVREWEDCPFPVHAVYGNHEFSQLSLEQVRAIFRREETYYHFETDGVRFVVLDTSYTPEGAHYSEDNFDWRYGLLPEEEIRWLRELLSDGKRTFVFTHNNLYFPGPPASQFLFQILNSDAVCRVLEEAGCVEAVFQGHHHTFQTGCFRGVRFVNIPSPERSPEYTERDFPLVEILEKGFLYNGKPITEAV